MRILYVLPILSHRGAERVALHLAQGLTELGHSPVLFFLSVSSHLPDLPSGLTIITPPTFILKLFKNKYLFLLFSQPVLFYYLTKLVSSTDIVHSESFPCLYLATLISKLNRKPVVWTIHAWQTSSDAFSKILGHLDRSFARYTNLILTVSPKTDLQVSAAFPSTFHQMILPPVNFSRLNQPTIGKVRQKYSVTTKYIILIVGTLHTLKNQALGLQALQSIPNTTLILLGEGNSDALKKQAEKLNLTSKVIFTGFVPDQEIKNYYNDADLILITSKGSHEGLGITGFESFYLNKMCLAVKAAGIADIYLQQGFGLVTEPQPDQIAKAARDYLSNRQQYIPNIRRGHAFVTNQLSIQSYASQVLSFYQKLLSK